MRQLSENDTHLSMQSQRLWMAIGNKDFNFEHQAKMTKVLEQLTFADIINFCEKWIKREQFGELILISSKNPKWQDSPSQQVIGSISEFKKTSNYLH